MITSNLACQACLCLEPLVTISFCTYWCFVCLGILDLELVVHVHTCTVGMQTTWHQDITCISHRSPLWQQCLLCYMYMYFVHAFCCTKHGFMLCAMIHPMDYLFNSWVTCSICGLPAQFTVTGHEKVQSSDEHKPWISLNYHTSTILHLFHKILLNNVIKSCTVDYSALNFCRKTVFPCGRNACDIQASNCSHMHLA